MVHTFTQAASYEYQRSWICACVREPYTTPIIIPPYSLNGQCEMVNHFQVAFSWIIVGGKDGDVTSF